MSRIRMVHIAAGSLSLIVDICQSNKERLEKQFDRQTCFYNAINSQTCLIHLRIWVIVVFFKKLLIDGKSQGRCSSYHNPLPFAHLTRWQWKIGQLNLRWHFHEKPAQLPLRPAVIMMFSISFFFFSRCSLHLITMSSPLSSQCRSWSCCGWRNAWQCRTAGTL